MTDSTAVVGIRFHRVDRLPLLRRALWSIAGQSFEHVHVVIACQDLDSAQVEEVWRTGRDILNIGGYHLSVVSEPNPSKKDLRAHLLNRIIEEAVSEIGARYLMFLDYDDVLFSHAVETLVEAFTSTPAALAYASVHCADVFMSNDAFYTKAITDRFEIGKKRKRDLLQDNFLPLHSYMFDIKKIDKQDLWYDEDMTLLEDYDLLLRLAASYPLTPAASDTLIGLYNFYTSDAGEPINTTSNVFGDSQGDVSDEWKQAKMRILEKHGAREFRFFLADYMR